MGESSSSPFGRKKGLNSCRYNWDKFSSSGKSIAIFSSNFVFISCFSSTFSGIFSLFGDLGLLLFIFLLDNSLVLFDFLEFNSDDKLSAILRFNGDNNFFFDFFGDFLFFLLSIILNINIHLAYIYIFNKKVN